MWLVAGTGGGRALVYGGTVAACGLAGGSDLPLTVYPFILRSVRLIGVGAVRCSSVVRNQTWQRLARDLSASALDRTTTTVLLDALYAASEEMLADRHRGRIVVELRF